MENHAAPVVPSAQDVPGDYVIRVSGWLDPSWVEFYDDLSVSVTALKNQQPVTRLSGHFVDQSALLGVLTALHHFGLRLLSVELVEPKPEARAPGGVNAQ